MSDKWYKKWWLSTSGNITVKKKKYIAMTVCHVSAEKYGSV